MLTVPRGGGTYAPCGKERHQASDVAGKGQESVASQIPEDEPILGQNAHRCQMLLRSREAKN